MAERTLCDARDWVLVLRGFKMADEFQDVLDEFLFDLANDILFEDIKTLENVSEA